MGIILIGILVLMSAGCSQKPNGNTYSSNNHSSVGTDSRQAKSGEPEGGTANKRAVNNGATIDKVQSKDDAEKLMDAANLSGDVYDFSVDAFRLTPEKTEILKDGSMIGSAAAPGSEKTEDLIGISYDDSTKFQILTMNQQDESVLSFEDTTSESVLKWTNVLVFGSATDEHNLSATRIVIVRYE